VDAFGNFLSEEDEEEGTSEMKEPSPEQILSEMEKLGM
jgi:hypothetical protein